MTFISLAHARRQLDIDPKTLRRWLAQAHLAVLSHPSDHRLKGISEPQLRELAQQHHRQLTTLAPDPLPTLHTLQAPASPDPSALLDLLHALHEQIAALQLQVSVLTAQLQPRPAPTSPAPPMAAPAPPRAPSPGKKPAPKPKPVAVIPWVEVGNDGRYVVISPKQGVLPFEPDTPAWFAWVREQESFRFVGKGGFFTAHHEWRVPRGAWRAHRHLRNYSLRLAPNHELTLAVLEEAAVQLQAHLN